MRTVIVGLDPGKNSGPLGAEYPSGKRLAELAEVDGPTFEREFDRVNLCPEAGGDHYEGAVNLRPILRGRRVITLGRIASEQLGSPKEWLKWELCGDHVAASMPHPSGLSRWWNDPANVREANRFMTEARGPCVHVEGPDGSGKSTLVSKLATNLDRDLIPTDDPPSSWDECLARVDRRVRPGIVCDRSSGLVSELVYGPVLRGGTITDEETIWGVVGAVLGSVTFIYCRPPESKIRPRFRDGEDPDHVRGVNSKGAELLRKYDDVMSRISRMGGRVIWYDWTQRSAGEVTLCVV